MSLPRGQTHSPSGDIESPLGRHPKRVIPGHSTMTRTTTSSAGGSLHASVVSNLKHSWLQKVVPNTFKKSGAKESPTKQFVPDLSMCARDGTPEGLDLCLGSARCHLFLLML